MAAMEEAVVTAKELSSSCFYSLSFDVSVRASEDLATADKLFTGALYIAFQAFSMIGEMTNKITR